MYTIAIITIGQSPRVDISQDLKTLFPKCFQFIEYGALDGLTLHEVKHCFGYQGKGDLLITRIVGEGQAVSVDSEKIMHRIQICIDQAEADGAHAILIACTGVFTKYKHKVPLFLPGESQRKWTIEQARGEMIGVVVPQREQQNQIEEWWRNSGTNNTLFGSADPYGNPQQIIEVSQNLKDAGAKILCLDCFGYTLAHQAAVEQAVGLTTVIPRAVLFGEMLRSLSGTTPAE